MSLKLNTSSGGSITLQEADTASNLTLTVPAQAGSIVTADSSGNVGIGTSSPADKLEVNGIIRSNTLRTGATNRTLELYSGTAFNTGGAAVAIRGSATGYNDNGMEFYTAGSERARIDSSGNLLVGTASGAGAKLEINKSNGGNTTGASNAAIYLPADESTIQGVGTTTQIRMGGNLVLRGNGQISAQSGNSGGVILSSGATSWSSASDSRLKNVIGTYTNALADISQIEPVKFTWKSDSENKPQVGVLAQSVQTVVPEAIDTMRLDKDDETDYLGVRYTELIPLMIAAIKEQQTIIQSQANTITAMEARLTALENK